MSLLNNNHHFVSFYISVSHYVLDDCIVILYNEYYRLLLSFVLVLLGLYSHVLYLVLQSITIISRPYVLVY